MYRLASFPYAFRGNFTTTPYGQHLLSGNTNLARINWLCQSGYASGSCTVNQSDQPLGAYTKFGISASGSFGSESWTRGTAGYTGFDNSTMQSLIDSIVDHGTNAQATIQFSKEISVTGTQVYSDDPGETREWKNYRFTFVLEIGYAAIVPAQIAQSQDVLTGVKGIYASGQIYFTAELYDSATSSGTDQNPVGGVNLAVSIVDPPDESGPSAIYNRGNFAFGYTDGVNDFGLGGYWSYETAVSDKDYGITAADLTLTCDSIFTPKTSF